MKNVYWSEQELEVIGIFARDQHSKFYGYNLLHRTKIKSGVLYPILKRFVRLGLLSLHREAEQLDGKSARTMYRITEDGVKQVFDLRQLLF